MKNVKDFRAWGAAVCLLLISSALPSCQAPGFIAANVLPIKKIKAVYHPVDQKTLVFVDDPRQQVPNLQLLSVISEKVGRDLLQQKVVTQFVPPAELTALRASQNDFAAWPIDRVGRELQASQVIYVLIEAFEPGGEDHETFRQTAAARVRVVDVQSGRRIFPQHGEHGVTSTLYFKPRPATGESHGTRAAVAQKLAEHLGADVAELFYDHNPREIGSGLAD